MSHIPVIFKQDFIDSIINHRIKNCFPNFDTFILDFYTTAGVFI